MTPSYRHPSRKERTWPSVAEWIGGLILVAEIIVLWFLAALMVA